MLWLALHFRHLPLEVFTRGIASNSQPIAIISGAETGATVVAANRPAQARGVSAGMSAPAACALAAELHTITRDTAKEHATLVRIAAWSLQFTSFVSLADSGDVLLEIEGSLKLFGGLGKLYQHIARGFAELGFNAHIACAPTPLAALWFARAGLAIRVQHKDALRHALEKLSADLLCDNQTTRNLLESFGARTLGDCLQLPRDGLARRAGQRLLDQLDRALGLRPDPRLPFVAPQTYSAALPLPAPVVTPRLPSGQVRVAVCGAHLAGLPLNGQLTSRGARLIAVTSSAPEYKLYALPGGPPHKPGMVRAAPGTGGGTVELEVWELPASEFGSFVAGIPAPLGIGTVKQADGSAVQGFVCEAAAVVGAQDITAFGGWRAYLARG